MQTNVFSISPTYGEQGREVTGYHVENPVSITVKDLQRMGEMLDAAVQAGTNQLYGITFTTISAVYEYSLLFTALFTTVYRHIDH